MTLVGLLIFLAVLFVLGAAAYYIINKFIAEPMRPMAMTIAGVVLLIVLLLVFLPEAANYPIFGRR